MDERTKSTGRVWIVLLALCVVAGARAQDCTLNGNPACGAAINLGVIAGDASSATITRSGVGEAHFYVRIRETSSASRALTARVQLTSPPGVDYELVLRCASCSGTAIPFAKAGAGATETAAVTRPDSWVDNSFLLFIEVRHYSGSSCEPWSLTIWGNTAPVSGALSCG
jgi:hypothetical protein